MNYKKTIAIVFLTAGMSVQTVFALAGDISGGWDFYKVGNASARWSDAGKELVGSMNFTRNRDGSYTGELIFQQAIETCQAKQSGRKWNIRCKLVEPIPNWVPDNFVLEEVGDNKMTGNLLSNNTYMVDFIRQ